MMNLAGAHQVRQPGFRSHKQIGLPKPRELGNGLVALISMDQLQSLMSIQDMDEEEDLQELSRASCVPLMQLHGDEREAMI